MKKRNRIIAIAISLVMACTSLPVHSIQAAEENGEHVVELQDSQVSSLYETYSTGDTYKRVSVHDPSIVVGYYEEAQYTSSSIVYGEQNADQTRKEVYFIFGSHRAFAYSTDLKSWTNFTNNISDDNKANTLFADGAAWAKRGDSVYKLVTRGGSNLWAPDVIWNPYYQNEDGTSGAWMMYMSVNGCSWNSSIALLTASTLNGDWTYRGTVIYSGFDNGTTYSYQDTDYMEVTGETELSSRYLANPWQWSDGNSKCTASAWNISYGAHAIDPCIVFDDDKELWMTYGSWSGGIYMIKIDNQTGLRDRTTTYDYEANVSDPYMGYKLAGGDAVSGEASYIQKMGSRYYLFVSNGELVAAGGYNIRVFSAANITGPYKDLSGEDARYSTDGKDVIDGVTYNYKEGSYTKYSGNNINGTVGNRLMSYYKWSFMNSGFVAQGHNSAFVDDDGKAYVVYHTRQDTTGEVHEVRVHQLFVAENGGLVTAPFEYSGETLADQAYALDEVTGAYQILTMGDTDYANKECVTEKTIYLNADGTVSGAYSGTWSQSADGPYVTIESDKVTYKGVFVEQKKEGTGWNVMCLTLVGDNDISIWGYGAVTDDEAAVAKAATETNVDIQSITYSDITLPTSGTDDVSISWTSSDPQIVADDGKLTLPAEDTEITLTAEFRKGEVCYRKSYTTIVCALGEAGIDTNNGLVASYDFNQNLTNSKNTAQTATLTAQTGGQKAVVQINAQRGSNVVRTYYGLDGARSYVQLANPLKAGNVEGLTVSMWVNINGDDPWSEIWSFYDGNNNRLFFTQNMYLGYNDGTDWFDCNNAATVTNDLKKSQWSYITISVSEDWFAIYQDGELKYTQDQYKAYSGSSYDSSMGKRILDLVNSATYFYLGYGAFWSSGDMSMDNVKIYNKALTKTEISKLYGEEKADMDVQYEAYVKAQQTTEQPTTSTPSNPSSNTTATSTPSNPPSNTTTTPSTTTTTTSSTKTTNSVEKGKIYTVGKLKYKVTSVSKKTVTVSGVKSKTVTSVTIGATVKIKGKKYKVTAIGESAFDGCKKLNKVVIGTNVTKIGKKAFRNCSKLKTIKMKSKKIKSVGKNAFKGIAKKAKIKVPSKYKKTYKKLFKNKGQKATVSIVKM